MDGGVTGFSGFGYSTYFVDGTTATLAYSEACSFNESTGKVTFNLALDALSRVSDTPTEVVYSGFYLIN